MRYFLFFYLAFLFSLPATGQTDTAFINRLNNDAEELSKKNTDSALILAQRALDLSVEKSFKAGKAMALKNLAVCNDIKGNSETAIKNFITAIKLFEALKDDNKIARCYSQMGISYYLQYQYENADLYYQKAIEIYKKINNEKDLAGVLINQGIAYTYLNKLKEAEINYLKALEIYKRINNEAGLSPAYNSLAKLYYHKKDFKTAIDYYKLSEGYSLRSNNSFNLISTYNSLALCYKELKQFDQAKIYSEKSIAICKEIGATERELFCYETLASICYETGDYKNAYLNYKAYADLKDTLFTKDKSDAIAEMQAKFDVESNRQKVKEIELEKKIEEETHTREKIILLVFIIVVLISLGFTFVLFRNKKRINGLLQANLEQKEIMMGEIHHRVKNNLQMVSSILDLQARDLVDEEATRVIEDSLNRINAISLIHQRLYQSENIRGIKINSYLKELANDIVNNFASVKHEKIELKFDIDDLDLESAIPIGLITAELVTNACKYAFKETNDPLIIVSLKKEAELILSVIDNGIGKKNKALNAGTSFGTKLIKSLARQLRAEVKETASVKGTNIALKITNFKLYA